VLAILPGRQCGFVTPSRMFTMTTRRIAIHLLTCAACMWAAASAQASVPSSFIGVSLEYSGIAPYYDVNPGRFEQLIRGLSPNPVIRIGGDSSGVTDADMLTPDWLAMVQDTSDATNASLIMDLNLRHPELIQDEASKLANGLTRIVALEIGNEPERLSRKVDWVTKRLIHYGRARAQTLGWPDARVLVIDEGQVVADGPAEQSIGHYQALMGAGRPC